MHEISETGWAKINLSLRVLGRRDDGYHELSSLVVFADVGDRLTLTGGNGFSLKISGPFSGDINGDNLVETVARAVLAGELEPGDAVARPRLPSPDDQISDLGQVHLEKCLPVAAGVGGGSADAAALLRLMERVGLCLLDDGFVAGLGKRFGADVPVCVAAMPAIMSGIGEDIARVAHFPALGVLMVNPGQPLSTAAVFKRLAAGACDGIAAADFRARQEERAARGFHSFDEVLAYMKAAPNDMTEAAASLCPGVGEVLRVLADIPDCRIARLSGSGATCFGLFDDAAAASAAAEKLLRQREDWWVMPASIRHV